MKRAVLLGLLYSFGLMWLSAGDFPSVEELHMAYEPLEEENSATLQVADSVVVGEGDISVDNNNKLVLTADSLLSMSSDHFFAPAETFKPSPRKAVIYSLLFPGLGQVYNRKYWKLPILYGGFVGFTYAITWNNGYYRDYLGAYQEIVDGNPDTYERWHAMLPYGRDPESIDQKWFTEVLQKRKDYYRYYRDFSIIGTVALYMLAVVDAYVDAQLFDFDMSPDLSMRIAPAVLRDEKGSLSAASSSYGLQFSFNF